MSKPKLTKLAIKLLVLDADTQARVSVSQDTVDEYADVIEASEGEWPFDPIDVFHDGSKYFVADGFHRTMAAIRHKLQVVPSRVHLGTAKDAKIFGMTANDSHGLRMSRADKRSCVEWLLDNMPDMWQANIAKTAGVNVRTVERIVAERKPKSHPTMSGKKKPAAKVDPEEKKRKAAEERLKKKAAAEAEKEAKKAAAKAEREAKKAEAEAEKLRQKEEAAAERKRIREEKAAAKVKAMPKEDQIRYVKDLFGQYIGKLLRLLDELHELKPNRAALNASIQSAKNINVW